MHISGNMLTNEMTGMLQINGTFHEHEVDGLMNENIRTNIRFIAFKCRKHIHRLYAIWQVFEIFTIDRNRAAIQCFDSLAIVSCSCAMSHNHTIYGK